MNRISLLALGTLAAFATAGAGAADGTAAASRATSAKKAPVKVAAVSRQALKSEAKGMALATETVEAISDAQMQVASRVLTGAAACEFNQAVTVEAVNEHPGHFRVAYKGSSYFMVPEETTTGAVRLVDRRNGMVWLQIPVKSMLMNQKIGQRMVDACMHAEQRAAASAVNVAGAKNSLE